MKNEPIQDYILKSEHNLSIAAAVGGAWPEIRQKLVLGFLGRLKHRLNRTLKGWEFQPWGGAFFVQADAGYYFWKPPWDGQYSVGLHFGERGEKMIFGVSRDKDQIGRRPFCQELLAAIAARQEAARQHSWWEARIPMASPAADWSRPEVLWRMHKDDTFLDDVAAQLLQVAKTSEPIVDRLVRKWKK